MSSPVTVTNDSVKSLASNIVNTSTSLATANITNNPIDIVNAAIANATTNPITEITMDNLVKKIDTDNKLKLYVTYEKDTNGELSIKDQYYIDATTDANNKPEVKKVEVNA